tara:strand:+ start:52 stop:609 length:558 start_codon:yes stop_codon:yes gene_type:complete
MSGFFRTTSRFLVVVVLISFLGACSSASSAGLNSFQSQDGRYGFLYPNGWTRVAVGGGPQVVFHDLINSDETLSLVVSQVGEDIDLEELGSPEIVGARLMEEVIAPEGTGRDVQLVQANARKTSEHTFYDLEYAVHLDNRDRHELATVVIDRGYLYTLATSTNEKRWPKVKDLFEKVITSFTFLI